MGVLRYTPGQSPLIQTKVSTNGAVKSPSNALTCSRQKPLIYCTLSKQGSEILPQVEKVPRVSPSIAPPSSAASEPLLNVSPSSLQCESGYLLPNKNLGRNGVKDGTLNAMEYLTNILASKVYDVAYETPLQQATKLSERWGVNVWLKREDLQPVCIN